MEALQAYVNVELSRPANRGLKIALTAASDSHPKVSDTAKWHFLIVRKNRAVTE
jgi:hypothetical protein